MDIKITLHKELRKHAGERGPKEYRYWVLRWYDTSGKRRHKYLGAVAKFSKREAEKRRVQLQLELEAEPGRRDARSVKLGDFLAQYFLDRRNELRPGTIELHEKTAGHLQAFSGPHRLLDAITRGQARSFKTALAEKKLSHVNKRVYSGAMRPTTVDRHIREARTIFAKAVDDGILRENPFDRLSGGKMPDQEWHYVVVEELARLMAVSRTGWKLLLGLARFAGLRAEEALRLPWRLVDLEQRRIQIIAHTDAYGRWVPKDSDRRIIPITPPLYDLLVEHLGPAEEMVIPPGQVVQSNIWRDFGPLCKKAGLARYAKPLHALRKSCITDWAREHPSHVVMGWAGHADFRTTIKYYLQASDSDFERATGVTQKVTQSEEEGQVEERGQGKASPKPLCKRRGVAVP